MTQHDFEEALRVFKDACDITVIGTPSELKDFFNDDTYHDNLETIQLALRIADKLQKGDTLDRLGVISSDLNTLHCPPSHITELQEIYYELYSIVN